MFEVRTLTAFTDKETGVFHKMGDTFSCSEERAKELSEKKVVVITDAPVKKTTRKKKG